MSSGCPPTRFPSRISPPALTRPFPTSKYSLSDHFGTWSHSWSAPQTWRLSVPSCSRTRTFANNPANRFQDPYRKVDPGPTAYIPEDIPVLLPSHLLFRSNDRGAALTFHLSWMPHRCVTTMHFRFQRQLLRTD